MATGGGNKLHEYYANIPPYLEVFMKSLIRLRSFLHKNGLFLESLQIKKLSAPPVPESYQSRVFQIGLNRKSPFLSWFPPEQRVYLPMDEDPEFRGEGVSNSISSVKEIMGKFGHSDWTDNEIFERKKAAGKNRHNQTLNFKWVSKNIITPYSEGVFRSKNISSIFNFPDSFAFSRYLIKIFNSFVRNTYVEKTIKEYLDEWGFEESQNIYNYKEVLKSENAAKLIESILEDIKLYYNEFFNFFNDSFRISKSSGLIAVISIKPEDIVMMSTGRRWTSCMNLEGGSHREDVFCEAETGGFVAYLIEEGDEDLDKPLARISVKRFESNSGVSIAVPETEVYSSGEDYESFKRVVNDWISEKQGDITPGAYTRRGGEWSDSFDKNQFFGKDFDMDMDLEFDAIKDPIDFVLREFDIKDKWIVEDAFYEDWSSYFEIDEDDEYIRELINNSQYAPEDPSSIFNFDHQVNPIFFDEEKDAKEWVLKNSKPKSELKRDVTRSLQNRAYNERLFGIYHYGADEDPYDMPYGDLGRYAEEKDRILEWIDENDRYTISLKSAMEIATENGEALKKERIRKIIQSLSLDQKRSPYYEYFLKNDANLNIIYNEAVDYEKSTLSSIFPDQLDFHDYDRKEFGTDYFGLSKYFTNINDEDFKKRKALELKQMLELELNYDKMIRILKKSFNSGSRNKPSSMYYERLVSAIHDSGAASFGNNFSNKLKTLLDNLESENEANFKSYPRLKDDFEKIVFEIFEAYDAHDPVALRAYRSKLDSITSSFRESDLGRNPYLQIYFILDKSLVFLSKITHLRESGVFIIPQLQELYKICADINNDDFSYDEKPDSDDDFKQIEDNKNTAKKVMTEIAKIISKISDG